MRIQFLIFTLLFSSSALSQNSVGTIELYDSEWSMKNFKPDSVFFVQSSANDNEDSLNKSAKVFIKYSLEDEGYSERIIAVIVRLYKSGDTVILDEKLWGKDVKNLNSKRMWGAMEIPVGENYVISIYDLDDWLLKESYRFCIRKK